MGETANIVQETGNHMIQEEGQVVVFRLAQEEFGVDINNVKEIVRLPDITPIPRSPEYVAGICNLRGSVLPVIETRMRFSMETVSPTDHTRLLVVETGGGQTSLIVDSVREVMRMSNVHIEAPPAVCKGVDREFLSGIIKVNNGERLILMLNLNEVLFIESMNDVSELGISSHGAEDDKRSSQKQDIEEEQLVSFKLVGDVYAFDISRVREILKIERMTSVPNVPDYVRGLFTIRNHLLPIIDLRGLLGMHSLVSEHQKMVDAGFEEDKNWVEHIKYVLKSDSYFTGTTVSRETLFGQWLDSYKTSSIEIESLIKKIKKARVNLYTSGERALALKESNDEKALSFLEENTCPLLDVIYGILKRFKVILEKHISEDQRALVVDAGNMTVGFLVDWVDEVIRIPRSVIDETPVLASSERRELKAVAKLDNGERLIMIMDEAALVSVETSRILDKIKDEVHEDSEDAEGSSKTLAQQSLNEVQLVTFSINEQEYGIHIMQVQEINRITEITSVPRAPEFIDGMTNLRGSVIPVINVRSLFGLEEKKIDDRTRIIIVDIDGNKTGLRVDMVNEVLRLSKRDIEVTPDIVTVGGANHYMEGVCKIDNGKRIVVLLNVEKILDEKELTALNTISGRPDKEPEKAKPAEKSDEQKKPESKGRGKKKPGKKKKLKIDE